MAERMSAMRRPGESEMDYYERRYQERVSHFLMLSLKLGHIVVVLMLIENSVRSPMQMFFKSDN